MTNIPESRRTFPRFLSFFDWAYLLDAVEFNEKYFEEKLASLDDEKKTELNTVRQSLYRAVFISAFATLEQNLDEIACTAQLNKQINLSPTDLRHRGIRRSIVYAQKVLGRDLDITQEHWKDVFTLQEMRNHLVHQDPDLGQYGDKKSLYEKLAKSKFVSFNPELSISKDQLTEIINLFIKCIEDY